MTTFAGFEYPHVIAQLPKGTPAKRLEEYRKRRGTYQGKFPRITGPYTMPDPHPLKRGETSRMFYLDGKGTDGDFQPGLRWRWADDVVSLRHKGWYMDTNEDDTYRGMVFRLNHDRGFLIGYSMGDGMYSRIDYGHIYEDEERAAHAADDLARYDAEESRRAYEEEETRQREEEKKEEEEQAQRDYVANQLEKAGWV